MVQKHCVKVKEDIDIKVKILNVYESHRWNIICMYNVIKKGFVIKWIY